MVPLENSDGDRDRSCLRSLPASTAMDSKREAWDCGSDALDILWMSCTNRASFESAKSNLTLSRTGCTVWISLPSDVSPATLRFRLHERYSRILFVLGERAPFVPLSNPFSKFTERLSLWCAGLHLDEINVKRATSEVRLSSRSFAHAFSF